MDAVGKLYRLIVNLTTPALVLWEEELPNDKSARNLYLQIEGHLQKYKEAFDDEEIWAVLSTKLSKILEIDYALRGEENGLIIERILILIRNVLYAATDDVETRPDNDANIHDRVLWALHQSGLLDIISYMSSSESESVYYLHILEILSFMLREQKPSELAQTTFERNQTEKKRDEMELMMIQNRERIAKQHKKTKMFNRHSRFGGTYVVKSMKSISDNDLIYHKPLSQLEALNFDANKTKPKTPKNRFPIKATTSERRSAFSIRLLLKEFCTEFLNGSYNTLMYHVKDNLVRARGQNHDESYYLWAMRFFMEFNRCFNSNFEIKLVSETMSVQTFHYVQQQCEHHYDMLGTEKKKLRQWSRRLHLALLAYKELLRTLSTMDKSQEDAVRESGRVIKNNIFYVLEYREFILTLLMSYDEVKMSDAYLKDLMETQYIFIKMLESFLANNSEIMVQSKSTKRSGKKKKMRKKNQQHKTKSTTSEPTVQELDANELHRMWDLISFEISAIMENNKEFSTDTPPFDATSDVPIDDQKAETMKKIQRKLRNNDFANAIGLLRAAREVWPENCNFGSDNMPIEEEFLALQDIFFADLGENQVPLNLVSAVNQDDKDGNVDNDKDDGEDDDDDDDDEEEGEEELPAYDERSYKFEDFTKRLPHPKIVRVCGLALEKFEANSILTNQCIVKLLHRIAFDCKMYIMVFQLSIFRTFQKIFALKDLPQYKELVKFATYIVRQFIKLSETNKKVFMETLFWKSSRECWEIEHGYDGSDGKATALRAWTEEQENEVRQLFVEHQETNQEEDVVDWVTKNLIDQSKSRIQVLRKLKEMMLLIDYKKKSKKNVISRSTIVTWSEEDEDNLRNLFEIHQTSSDPLQNIVENMENPKPKSQVVDKLLSMGLIQNKRELRKKKLKDKDKKMKNGKEKSIKYKIKIKQKKPSGKLLPQSKTHIAKLLIEVVDSGIIQSEALEWLRESLLETIPTDTENATDNEESVPLVPVNDCEEFAMKMVIFQQLLKSLGIGPPKDEQEKYWRIPAQLPPSEIEVYCAMIHQAMNKTLVVPIEEAAANTVTPPIFDQINDTFPNHGGHPTDGYSSGSEEFDDYYDTEDTFDFDVNNVQFEYDNYDDDDDDDQILSLASDSSDELDMNQLNSNVTEKSTTETGFDNDVNNLPSTSTGIRHTSRIHSTSLTNSERENNDKDNKEDSPDDEAQPSGRIQRRAMRWESEDEDNKNDDAAVLESRKRSRSNSSSSSVSESKKKMKRVRAFIDSDDDE